MGLRNALTDSALPLALRAAGSGNSGPVAQSGLASALVLYVHCTAITGTTPTLDVSLEDSADGVTYAAVTGSGITQLTAAGNRVVFCGNLRSFVRVTYTVGGTAGPTATFRADVLVLPE